MQAALKDFVLNHPVLLDLHIWGPTIKADVINRFGEASVADLRKKGLLVSYRYGQFSVLTLSWRSEQAFGGTAHNDKRWALSTVISALLIRVVARIYQDDGYAVTPYTGYSSRGRDDILLVERDGIVTAVIGRRKITLRSVRLIIRHLLDSSIKIENIEIFTERGPLQQKLSRTLSVFGLPMHITQFSREMIMATLNNVA